MIQRIMVFIVLVYALWAEGRKAPCIAAKICYVLGGVPTAGDYWGLGRFGHFLKKNLWGNFRVFWV
jgi:hypothetical protein